MSDLINSLRELSVTLGRFRSDDEVDEALKEAADRIAVLSRNLDHWKDEVGKLHARIDRFEAEQEQRRKVIRFALGWVRHWQEDVASDLKPTPESLALVEAKLKEALEDLP